MLCVAADSKPERKKVNQEQPELDLSAHVHELEDCLQEVLSDVLKVEMKAAFDDLWLEVKLHFFMYHKTVPIFPLHAIVGISCWMAILIKCGHLVSYFQ